jgi:L-asparagine oxygenase
MPAIQTITLDSHEHSEMVKASRLLDWVDHEKRPTGIENWVKFETARRHIPVRISATLNAFQALGNDDGALLIRNLPIDEHLPFTPSPGQPLDKQSQTSENILCLCMSHMGEPICYADEKNGQIIQDIFPISGEEEKQENSGSSLLEFHTENGFHPNSPDYLALLCLRPDHDRQAKTAVASVRRALSRIPGRLIEALRRPQFRIEVSSSFRRASVGMLETEPMPVLRGDPRDPLLCVDAHAMRGETAAAQQALSIFIEVLKDQAQSMVLETGDLLVIDNRMAAHARNSFKPRYDGYDRWLQRISTVVDRRQLDASRWPNRYVCIDLPIERSANPHLSEFAA